MSGPLQEPADRIQAADLGIAITTLDGFFTFVNSAWASMHCYSPDEMLGRHLSMCHTGAQMANLVVPLDDRAVQSGQESARIRHIDKYGNVFTTFMTVTLQPGRGRLLPHLIRVARPVGGQGVNGTSELPVNWLDETGALILDFNLQGRLRYANQRWLDALGYTAEEAAYLRLDNVTHPDHHDQWWSLLNRFAAGEDTASIISVFVTRTGEELVVEGSLSAHVDDAGMKTIRAVLHDITHRRKVEREVRAQRALAQALRDTAVVLNSTLDLNEVLERVLDNVGRIVEHDEAAVLLADEGRARVVRARGDAALALQGEQLSMVQTPALARMIETGQALILTEDDLYQGRWPLRTGAERAMLAAPIRLKDEAIGFLLLTSATPGAYGAAHAERLQLFADHAATALHNAQLYEEIQRMVSTLHERNADLKAFSHTVAHDLKAPLQVLVGYSNLIASEVPDDLPDEIREGLRYIEAYAYKMKSMIDNLLLFSELGSADVELERVDMQVMVSLVLARFFEQLNERGVTVAVAADLPDAIAYSPWLEEVFANLIDNAIKYIGEDNEYPRIEISGYVTGDKVRYLISDNGVGIRPEDQASLFQMFTRFHRQAAEGSGLGLSIARRIITKLQGQIGVESEPGAGTTFWIELPAAGEPEGAG